MARTTSGPPAQRADAARNREKIVAAARAAFAGPDASGGSMAQISRRAGVGMATLYRNFPGRRELLEALYVDEVDAVVRAAEASAEAPGVALTIWLRRFFTYATSKRHVTTAILEHSESDNPVFGQNRARVLDVGRPLLAAAQADHAIRTDLTLEQILDMVVAIATIQADPDYLEPILQAALDGLRPTVRDTAPRLGGCPSTPNI